MDVRPVRAARACALALALVAARPATAHEPGDEEPPARTAPALLERFAPIYPEAARRAGIGGTVALELAIAPDGSVASVKVLRPAGHGLDEAAVAAARRFRFKPATEMGRPVAATVLFDQSFTIRPHLAAEVMPEEEAAAPPAAVAPAPAAVPPRYETTVVDRGATSAASASTVRNLDFDLRPKSAPNDLLRAVPGLLAVQHQGGGKGDQIFLRGFDADHGTDVAVYLDGVPINLPSHAHGQGFVDLHFLIPEAIQQIDVVKGPYDARYGDFATAGAVNFVTRKRFESSSVQATVAGFPTVDGRLVAGARFVGVAAPDLGEKLRPWIAFEAAQADGPFASPQGLRRYNLLGKVSYDLSPATTVGLLLSAYGGQWSSSGQIPSREVDAGRLARFGAVDPSEGGLTERQMAVGFLRHKDAGRELEASIYLTRYRLNLWNNFTFFLRDPDRGDLIEQDDARTTAGGRLAYHFHARLARVSFRTTLGAEVRWDGAHVDLWDATSQGGDFRKRVGRHVDPSRFAFGSDVDVEQLHLGAFAEEDVALGHHLRLIAGLRTDYFGFAVSDRGETLRAGAPATSGTAQRALVSPKATLVVTPLHALDLYLNFGTGFHSNDARIAVQEGRFVAAEGQTVVNTVPRIYGGELGARLHLFDRVTLAGALWASYLENETVFSGDGGIFEPSDPTRRIGFDLEARARILPWLFADLDVAQAEAVSVPRGRPGGLLALAPRLYLTGGVTIKHPAGVRAGLRFRYLGERPAFNTDSDEYRALAATQPRRVIAEEAFVIDLYGAWRWRFLEASVAIQNLVGQPWREAQFGNNSCTRAEVDDPGNPGHAACGRGLSAGSRTGNPDVHFTPGVPLHVEVGLKAYF